MSSLMKYRVHEVAKDFGVTSKVVTEILTQYASTPKNHMQVLEDEELSIIFEYMTQHNQVGSIAEVFADTEKPQEPERKEDRAEAETGDTAPAGQSAAGKSDAAGRQDKKQNRQPQQAAQSSKQQPAQQSQQNTQQRSQPKPDKPHVPKKMPEKKVVDTRGSANTNLSKYDERFDRMAGDKAEQGRRGKQKIGNKNKQRQSQMSASAKRRQEEREKMQRLQFEIAKKAPTRVQIPDEISVQELAVRMKKTGTEVVRRLVKMGVMATRAAVS